MKTPYLVTVEFPAPYNCERGEVDWVRVEAEDEEEAKHLARIDASRHIKINKVIKSF